MGGIGGKKVRRLAGLLTLAVLLGTRAAASAEIDADTLLQTYDTGTPERKTAIEQTVSTAESAFREASFTIVLQRNEIGLYCPKDFSADSLIEMIRRQVSQTKFVGKYPFEMSLLHALQVEFPPPCPLRSK
ncbi:MAG: hypothetical protein ACLPSW_00730 [Roseiarcus sp.]